MQTIQKRTGEEFDELALVQSAKKGDLDAFSELVNRYDRNIFRIAIPREVADWAPNPEQNFGQSELGDILRKTIQGLPPGFRTVFVLRDVEGLSTEETAEMLDLSVPAVKSRLLRARLQLRERLAKYFRSKNGDGKREVH